MNRAASCHLLAVAMALALASCSRAPREANRYEVTLPPGWTSWARPAPPVVPGTVLEAFETATPSGPASYVIFRSPYAPDTTAAQLTVETRYLLLHLPSLTIQQAKEVSLSGTPAALVEGVAAGTGDALAPTGLGKPVLPEGARLQPTHFAWLRVPREPELGTLEVLFACPDAEEAKVVRPLTFPQR